MKISVVTVAFNSSKTIPYTIESFLRQRHADKEMIVVDGGSRDGTPELARSYKSDAIRVLSEPDRGTYDAMNKGLRLFTGDAVGFLNSDDAFHDEQALSCLAEALEEFDVAYGDLNMVTDHTTRITRRVWRPGQYRRFAFQLGWAAPHPTFYVRRRVVEKVGEFVASYKIAADYDFMIRALAMHQFRSTYIPRLLVDFQLGGISSSGWRAAVQGNLECRTVRRIRLNSPPVDAAMLLRPLRRVFQQRWRAQAES